MKILHVVPGVDAKANGIAVAAKLIASRQDAELVDAAAFARGEGTTAGYDEIWVHSMWLPSVMRSCFRVLKAGVPLVRMTHANLDPVRLGYHGWKKRLVAPIERWLFKRTARVVVTGEWEAAWCRLWGLANEIATVDLKKCFGLVAGKRVEAGGEQRNLHLLYLGRRHPLKGVEYLERAVEVWNKERQDFSSEATRTSLLRLVELRCVSDVFGEELERVWDWCDVLVLPTLSENFGLVVAEALERGKWVIVTDGAPAWEEESVGRQLVYVRGFRDGTDDERVKLLVQALGDVLSDGRSQAVGG